MEDTLKKINSPVASQNFNEVVNFLDSHTQFIYTFNENLIELTQKEDHKKISIEFDLIEKVLTREDVDGSKFLQLNFNGGSKILVTKNLVGFKPNPLVGFDLNRIPKVVTTLDLQSVSKAIEDLFDSEETIETQTEIEILKKVYQSILFGAENIGFKMQAEKTWFSAIMLNPTALSA